jgi:hypothetical protein
MKKKHSSGGNAFVVTVSLAVICGAVPLGVRQDSGFCEMIQAVVDESENNFAGVRGSVTRVAGGITFYEAPSISLPRADDCYVSFFPEGSGWQYACVWQTPARQDRTQEYEALAAGVRGCYPSGRVMTSSSGQRTSIRVGSARISVSVQEDLRVPQVRLGVSPSDRP